MKLRPPNSGCNAASPAPSAAKQFVHNFCLLTASLITVKGQEAESPSTGFDIWQLSVIDTGYSLNVD